MNHVLSAAGRRIIVAGATMLCGIALHAGAQSVESRDPSRWSLGVAVHAGEMPEAMGAQCGAIDRGEAMAGLGAALLFTPRTWLVMSSDVRISGTPAMGCKLTIPAPTYLGNNQWQTPVYRDYRDVPTSPLMRSAVRVGVQTPRGLPLLRATIGGGVLWKSTPAPFVAGTVGIGTRGTHVRFYTELEADIARIRVVDQSTIFHYDAGNAQVIDARTATPRVIHSHITALHIGVELPLR